MLHKYFGPTIKPLIHDIRTMEREDFGMPKKFLLFFIPLLHKIIWIKIFDKTINGKILGISLKKQIDSDCIAASATELELIIKTINNDIINKNINIFFIFCVIISTSFS